MLLSLSAKLLGAFLGMFVGIFQYLISLAEEMLFPGGVGWNEVVLMRPESCFDLQ